MSKNLRKNMLKTVVKNGLKLQNPVRDECERKKSVCVYYFSFFKNYEGKNFFRMCKFSQLCKNI